jgi:hypothetical protein
LREASEPLAASEAWRDAAISFVLHKLEIALSAKVRQSALAEQTRNDNADIFQRFQ